MSAQTGVTSEVEVAGRSMSVVCADGAAAATATRAVR